LEKSIKIIICLLLSLAGFSQPRSVKFDRYNSSDGLSENNVYAIYKDSQGFMWFGTDDGLNRFDGYSFYIYRPNDIGERHLPGNQVRCIAETPEQNILVGFQSNGLCAINRQTDNATRFVLPLEVGNEILEYSVYDIEKLSDSVYWIATDYGIYVFDPELGFKDRLLKGLPSQGGLATNKTRNIFSASTGFIWITHANGEIDKYDRPNKKAFRVQLGDYTKTAINEDSYGNIWIGSWGGGLYRITPNGQKQQYRPDSLAVGTLSDSIINYNSIATDDLGRLWIGTFSQGLNELSQQNGEDSTYFFIKHKAKHVDNMSIASDAVLSTYFDKDGILWIGHRGGGISKVNLYPKRFYNYILPAGNKIGKNIQCITNMPDGTLWVGTQTEGIYIFNQKTNRYSRINNSHEKGISLQSNNVTAITPDSSGNVWIGTDGGGLSLINTKKKTATPYLLAHEAGNKKPSASISSIYIDIFGYVWIATKKTGLFMLRTGNQTAEKIELPNSTKQNINISKITVDNEGYIWLCTDQHGAFYFKPQQFTENIQFVNVSPHSETQQLPHQTVYDIAQTGDNLLWIATGGAGVIRYNRKERTISAITERDGLPTDVVRSVLADENGLLWISTHKGLCLYSPLDGQVHLFNQQDGLMTENFLNGSSCKADKRIYFGADEGFVGFRPDQITLNYNVPQVVLSELLIFNTPIPELPDAKERKDLFGPLYAKQNITLSYQDYVFSIAFAAIELNTPQKCTYQYKLEGFDDKWIFTDASKRIATYTNLRDGSYTFKVKASNGDGVWSKTPTEIEIEILPPFWETIWFRLFVGFLFVSISFVYYYYREKQFAQRKETLETLVSMRTKEVQIQKAELQAQTEKLAIANTTKDRFFSIIAHDLKSPFNAFIGFTSMLKNNFSDYPDEKKLYILNLISNSAQTMFELLNNLLSWARAQSGAVDYNPEKLELRDEIENVVLLLTTPAAEKQQSLVNAISGNMTIKADKNLLSAVLRNIISNSIKFTEEHGCITISAKQNNNTVLVTVTDTGVGMTQMQLDNLFKIDTYSSTPGTKKEKGTGLGLVVAKEFVEINGGTISISSEKDNGTQVSFSVPAATYKQR